jgi:fucose permease
MAFATMLCEGAAADWSAVYLEDVTGAPAGVSGVGFVAFAACMLVTRTFGDRALLRFGPDRLVRSLAAGAAVVFALALATARIGSPFGAVTGVLGFAALGVGAACVFPAGISAAVRVGATPGMAVAAFVTVGSTGWLCGPVIVGGLAEVVGLRPALSVVLVLLGAVVVLAPAFAAPPRPAADPPQDVNRVQNAPADR